MPDKLECRVVIRDRPDGKFELGMHDPVDGRYAPLGVHPKKDKAKIVGDLRDSIERAGHRVSFSEQMVR